MIKAPHDTIPGRDGEREKAKVTEEEKKRYNLSVPRTVTFTVQVQASNKTGMFEFD